MATAARTDDAPTPPPLSEPDRELLEFMAEHRIVEVAQATRLLGASRGVALARLRQLRIAGYARRERPFGGPWLLRP